MESPFHVPAQGGPTPLDPGTPMPHEGGRPVALDTHALTQQAMHELAMQRQHEQWSAAPPAAHLAGQHHAFDHEPRGGNVLPVAAGVLATIIVVGVGILLFGQGGGGNATRASAPTSVRGTLGYAKGSVTITDAAGAAHTFPVASGPETQPGALMSLAASHRDVVAHVTSGKVDSVEVAPPPGRLASKPGLVTAVSSTSITLHTAAGAETFTIRDADRAAMDVPHMREHMAAKAGVLVHYDTGAGGAKYARSFEDAPVTG